MAVFGTVNKIDLERKQASFTRPEIVQRQNMLRPSKAKHNRTIFRWLGYPTLERWRTIMNDSLGKPTFKISAQICMYGAVVVVMRYFMMMLLNDIAANFAKKEGATD